MEKLIERFVGPYKVKKIVLANIVKLELPSTTRIHPVVNVSRIHRYIGQVEGQRKEPLAPVIIKGEKCYETPKRERSSCAFEHLIQNLKSYNGIKI